MTSIDRERGGKAKRAGDSDHLPVRDTAHKSSAYANMASRIQDATQRDSPACHDLRNLEMCRYLYGD